jgi:hypothetical protein
MRSPAVALLIGLCASGLASAQRIPSGPFPSVGPPLLLRLEGTIEHSAEAARGKGFTVTSLGFLGSDARRWLAVTKARTFGGDQPLDGKDVLALVAPFTPNFLVTGPRPLLDRLLEAPPGTPVRIEGLVDRGSRTYQLRTVEREPETPGG